MTQKQKQALLAYLGYYDGQLDGIWGAKSQRATEAFQRDYQLTVDGIFGAGTEQRIREVVASGETPPVSGADSGVQIDAGEKTGTFWDEIEYIRRDEPYISCPCGKCGGFPEEPTERLIRAADMVRKHFNSPLIPTSTIRCQEHNKAVGGVDTSRHLKGRAMDFYIQGHSSAEVLAFVWTLCPSYAYAIDGSAVHMDF